MMGPEPSSGLGAGGLGVGRLGFTFVELLVVVGIMLLIAGGSITAFTRFREKRATENEAREISELLELAQRKSLSGEKPQACLLSTLEGYQVRVTTANRLEVWALCEANDTLVSAVDLDSTVTAPAVGANIDFGIVRGGVTEGTVEICGAGYSYQVEVIKAGSISGPIDAGSC